jgi:hypothetical protein
MRLTKKGLLARAKARGFDPSPYLIDDWVQRGLLDSPQRKGRGRGRGVASLWSEEQVQLLLLLLGKREELPGRSLGPLYNIPVALWLLWGDQYASTFQVRRAVEGWLGAYGRTALRKARAVARQHLEQLTHPDAEREFRDYAFEELLAAIRGTPDLAHLRDAIGWLFDPHDEGRAMGPPAAALTPENLVRLIEARLLAWQKLDSVSDEQFRIARLSYNTSLRDYQRDLPTLAEDAELGHLFDDLTVSGVINRACLDLLTHLGLGLLSRKESALSGSGRAGGQGSK